MSLTIESSFEIFFQFTLSLSELGLLPPKYFSKGFFPFGVFEHPTSYTSSNRITTLNNSSIVIGRFSLFHTLRQIDLSRLARNAPIMPNCGFFRQSYYKYLDLYFLAYRDKFWSLLHFITLKDVTLSRCWCGLRHASITYSFIFFYGKNSSHEPLPRRGAIDVPSLRNKPKFLTLTSSSMYYDALQYVSYSVRIFLNILFIIRIPRHGHGNILHVCRFGSIQRRALFFASFQRTFDFVGPMQL